MEGHVPQVQEVRERIDRCGDAEFRQALRAGFLMCARISEVVGRSTPGDSSTEGYEYQARGPSGTDAKALMYEPAMNEGEGYKAKALVIIVKTAKREGLERWIGLPVEFDPWVRPTAEYFWSKGSEKVFPFTRQAISDYVKSNGVFEGLLWPVQRYEIVLQAAKRNDKGDVLEESVVKKVDSHMKPFTIHSLRDARASYLLIQKHFDGVGLAIHGGWAINRAATGISQVMARYLHFYQEWWRPFPKLLPPLEQAGRATTAQAAAIDRPA